MLLLIGGFALDRVLTASIVDNFDSQLEYVLNAMIASSEIGPDGEVRFNRPPADQRFLEPYSGLYFQISGAGADTFPSRSLWDRRLRGRRPTTTTSTPHIYDSDEFAGRAAADRRARRHPARLARSAGASRSRSRARSIDEQIRELRATLVWSFAVLGLGLLDPRRAADRLRPVAAAPRPPRGRRDPLGRARRGSSEDFPREIEPLTEEINAAARP